MKPAKQYDVIGVGRAVYDYTVLVERYPENNTKTEAIDRFEGGGSPVPNALCQLAVWGHRTLLNAVIGDDREGNSFLADTVACGVDTGAVKTLKDTRTPHAFLWVEKGSGNRTIVLDRNIAPLSPKDVPFNDLKSCRSLLIDGWEADAAIEAANIVRSSGGKVMLDAGNVRPRMEELLAVTDWIVVPMAFCRAYYGGMNLSDAVKDLRSRGMEIAVITNGSDGCIASWGDEVQCFPAFKAEIVDTTGAGDIFHAGMLHGLLKSWSVPDTIRWASAAAALTIGKLGGRGGLSSEEEVYLYSQVVNN